MALHFARAKKGKLGWMGFDVDFAGVAGRFTIHHQSRRGGSLGLIQLDQSLIEKMPEKKYDDNQRFGNKLLLEKTIEVQCILYSVFYQVIL